MACEFEVRCKSCNKVIGGRYRNLYYDKLKMEPTLDKLVPTVMEEINPDFDNKSVQGRILDEIGIKLICCRKIFLTHDEALLAEINSQH